MKRGAEGVAKIAVGLRAGRARFSGRTRRSNDIMQHVVRHWEVEVDADVAEKRRSQK